MPENRTMTESATPPEPASAPDPTALIRSRSYIALLLLGAVLGVPVATVAYFFLVAVSKLQTEIFTDLPKDLGFGGSRSGGRCHGWRSAACLLLWPFATCREPEATNPRRVSSRAGQFSPSNSSALSRRHSPRSVSGWCSDPRPHSSQLVAGWVFWRCTWSRETHHQWRQW